MFSEIDFKDFKRFSGELHSNVRIDLNNIIELVSGNFSAENIYRMPILIKGTKYLVSVIDDEEPFTYRIFGGSNEVFIEEIDDYDEWEPDAEEYELIVNTINTLVTYYKEKTNKL